jgi:CCR4-NOT transcription complex subunit 1
VQQQRQQLQSGSFSLVRDGHPVRAFTPSQAGTGAGQSGSDILQQQQQQQGSFTEQTVIPNLASYITVSAQVASGPAGAMLRRIAPVAVDRAIREIIQPVVERSVTIACITTKELVTKDFATEPDEGRMRKAAQLMVSNLAGSLALVTCKEPLRVSIAKHLRALLQQQPGTNLSGNDQHEQHAVQTCAAENLDLGCMLIEKAATEKAIRDVDDALAPTFKGRQKRFEQGNGYTDIVGPYGASTGRYPAALPSPYDQRPQDSSRTSFLSMRLSSARLDRPMCNSSR